MYFNELDLYILSELCLSEEGLSLFKLTKNLNLRFNQKYTVHNVLYRLKRLLKNNIIESDKLNNKTVYSLFKDKICYPNGSVVYIVQNGEYIHPLILHCRYAKECEGFINGCVVNCKLDQDLHNFFMNNGNHKTKNGRN